MTTQRKILKGFIIVILAVFLLSSALVSVMYLSNKGPSATDQLSGDDSLSGIVLETGIDTSVDTGKALSTMTKEEAAKELKNLLSGVNTSGLVQ